MTKHERSQMAYFRMLQGHGYLTLTPPPYAPSPRFSVTLTSTSFEPRLIDPTTCATFCWLVPYRQGTRRFRAFHRQQRGILSRLTALTFSTEVESSRVWGTYCKGPDFGTHESPLKPTCNRKFAGHFVTTKYRVCVHEGHSFTRHGSIRRQPEANSQLVAN